MGRTIRDELIRNFEQSPAPASNNASAARPDDASGSPSGGREPNAVYGLPRELPSLFQGENPGPLTTLPESVSAAQIADENERLWGNIGPAKKGGA
jgi:hypothetical protein